MFESNRQGLLVTSVDARDSFMEGMGQELAQDLGSQKEQGKAFGQGLGGGWVEAAVNTEASVKVSEINKELEGQK